MELSNEFEVAVPVEQAWAVLTDVERIAPCLPGAQLQEIEGDDFKGIVKVKVGPITAQYKGTATFVEKDEVAHKAVLSASGRDTRGQGNASATIVAELQARGDASTHVSVLTDLAITGKVAQFGRGVMADVSAKLLDQFVQNLETTVLADLAATTAAVGATDAPAAAAASAAESVTTDAPAGGAARPAPGEVARKAKDTTEMLASELAKAVGGGQGGRRRRRRRDQAGRARAAGAPARPARARRRQDERGRRRRRRAGRAPAARHRQPRGRADRPARHRGLTRPAAGRSADRPRRRGADRVGAPAPPPPPSAVTTP